MRTVLITCIAVVAILAGKVMVSTILADGNPIPQDFLFGMTAGDMCFDDDVEVCVGLVAVPYMGTYHWSIVSRTQFGWGIQSWYPDRWSGMKAPVEFLLSFVSPVGVPGTVRFDDPILRANKGGDIILLKINVYNFYSILTFLNISKGNNLTKVFHTFGSGMAY